MKNAGKGAISLILKAIILTLIIFLLGNVYATDITPEVITTTFPEPPENLINSVDRFYEVSEKSLEVGYNTTLTEDSAFKISIEGTSKYLFATNISDNSIQLIFVAAGETTFNKKLLAENYVIFKIEDINLEFRLHLINSSGASVGLKLFEQEIPTDADYFELFDIKVRLAESTIYTPTDLSAIIEFTNFGEGPSSVRLIYSVLDANGKEYYTGIDEKTIETNEVTIKNFETLSIPNGDYIVKTTIYYGDNQEATSEEAFTLKEVPKFQVMKQPIVFIGIILAGLALVIFLKKRKNKAVVITA